MKVLDFDPLRVGQGIDLRFQDGSQARGEIWSELIELDGAEAVATFNGSPAITRHRFGDGTAFYLGTMPDQVALARVLEEACSVAEVNPVARMPQAVETVRRYAGGKSILFVLNHRDLAVDVPIEETGTNLIDGSEVHRGLMRLEPRGVAIIKEGW